MATGADHEPAGMAVARQLFGASFPVAESYAGLLTGPAIERGLLGPAEASRIWDRHLLNCGVLAELLPARSRILDLGSGAGLPGLVLAILRPSSVITLLEPMARRAAFLRECADALNLGNVTIRRARAEDIRGEAGADFVTARAVAPLTRLAGWAAGLTRPGGTVLAVKGNNAPAELAAAQVELRRLNITDACVVLVGHGKIDPPVTVVRMTIPPQRPSSPSRRVGR